MARSRRFATVSFFLLFPTLAAAQEPRTMVTVKGGATIENSEDGLTGTVPAAGIALSRALTPRWHGEIAFWLPGYLKDSRGEPKHRDVLFSGSVLRVFTDGPVRPFASAGIALARTEDRFTLCAADRVPPGGGAPVRAMVDCADADVIERRTERNTGSDGYLLAGGGVTIAAGRRVRLVADVRFTLAPASILVLPGVGVSIGF